VEVVTFMVSIGQAARSKPAIWIYDPFGPYPGAFDGYYDPTVASDRARAASNNYRGDYTVKLWIGGKIKHLLLDVLSSVRVSQPTQQHAVWAVNLFPSEGNIDQAQLLFTPSAQNAGVPENARVLFTYRGEYLLGDARGGPCPDGYSAVSSAAQCAAAVADLGELLAYVPSKSAAEGAGVSCTWCGGPNEAYLKKKDESCEEKRFVCRRTAPVGPAKPSVDCKGEYGACEFGTKLFTQSRKKFGAGKVAVFVGMLCVFFSFAYIIKNQQQPALFPQKAFGKFVLMLLFFFVARTVKLFTLKKSRVAPHMGSITRQMAAPPAPSLTLWRTWKYARNSSDPGLRRKSELPIVRRAASGISTEKLTSTRTQILVPSGNRSVAVQVGCAWAKIP
jgi:hypothetical protein